MARDLIRSDPFLVTAGSTFNANYRRRLKEVKVRPDDVWIITHPKEKEAKIVHLITRHTCTHIYSTACQRIIEFFTHFVHPLRSKSKIFESFVRSFQGKQFVLFLKMSKHILLEFHFLKRLLLRFLCIISTYYS